MFTTKANLLTKNPTKNSWTIWDYEVGYYKYINNNQTSLNCINLYPFNKIVEQYLKSQDYINIESENNLPKLYNGKIVILI